MILQLCDIHDMISSNHPLGFVEDVYLDFFYIFQSWSIILCFSPDFFKKRLPFFLRIMESYWPSFLPSLANHGCTFPGRFQESLLPDGFLGHVLGNVVTWPFSASRGGEFSFAKG